MEKIKSEFSKGNFREKDRFKNIEKDSTVGIDIYYMKKIAYENRHEFTEEYSTLKSFWIEGEIKNKNEIILKSPEYQKHRCLVPEKWTSAVEFVIRDKQTREEYPEYPDTVSKSVVEVSDIKDLKAFFHQKVAWFDEIANTYNINVKDTGYHYVRMTRQILYDNLKYICGCEFVQEHEEEYLNKSHVGALMYADLKAEFTDGYDYDINSYYGWILARSEFCFPADAGELVKNNDKKYPLEIAKLIIKGHHKYFRRNEDDYYNTYQIQLLEYLKIDYERDTTVKRLVWRNVLKSRDVFGYMEPLFELKKNGNKEAKHFITRMWGLLGMKKRIKYNLDVIDEEHLDKIVKIDLVRRKAWLKTDDREYKFVFGRLKTFINAFERYNLVKTYLVPLEQDGFKVFMSNTDGFLTDAKPDDIKKMFVIGENVGELKNDKTFMGHHVVKNMRVVEQMITRAEYDEDDEN